MSPVQLTAGFGAHSAMLWAQEPCAVTLCKEVTWAQVAANSCSHVASPETFAVPPKHKIQCYLVQNPEQLKVLFIPPPLCGRSSVGQAVSLGEQRASGEHRGLGAPWVCPQAPRGLFAGWRWL